jgi:hypothetical protein
MMTLFFEFQFYIYIIASRPDARFLFDFSKGHGILCGTLVRSWQKEP